MIFLIHPVDFFLIDERTTVGTRSLCSLLKAACFHHLSKNQVPLFDKVETSY